MIRRIQPAETFLAIWADDSAQAWQSMQDMAESLYGDENMPTRFIHLLEDGKTQRDCTADIEQALERIEQDRAEEAAHQASIRALLY